MADEEEPGWLEKQLHELPDQVADALLAWRRATIKRQHMEAYAFVRFKKEAISSRAPGDDYVKSQIRSTDEWVKWMDEEAAAESNYVRLYEKHMSNKKTAGIRAAY